MTTGSHYTVLARRFRPQAFGDVVGQEHVAQALRNAIRSGRVAHAYLFTGARGVGKTSTARILAKALNCPNADDGVPCNECDICKGISSGQDVDVLEIDGASNRGIDDIRSLRANVGVRSMRTQYKVYIIDEVHMLTKEAFNALLKTLEEPPPNVKFVFCTTEPNKVPDTILSRCQRFDFSAINEESIARRLEEIAKAEGFEVSADALELVARRARGSMRDSQSLFDQLLAFSSGTVESEDVHRMLGTADDDRLVSLMDAAIEHRPGEVLVLMEAAVDAGVQVSELAEQLISYIRDLMVTQCGGDAVSLSSVAARHRPTLTAQGRKLGLHSVMAAFQILNEARNQMFRSTFARTILEMALVQISVLENLSAISEVLSGRLPTLPDLTRSQTATPQAATPESGKPDQAGSDPQKKNSELNGSAASAVVEEPVSQKPPEPIREMSAEAAAALLKQVSGKVGMSAGSALQKAAGFRLSGPNRFEIALESTADMARRVLEQAETRNAIDAELSKLVGQPVTTGLKVVAAPTEAPSAPAVSPSASSNGTGTTQANVPTSGSSAGSAQPSSKPNPPKPAATKPTTSSQPPVNLINDIDPKQDPFVKHVMDAFGATVVRVMPAPEVKGANVE
ncbi:MAG: DNA polymerase III subunit gamma/tau [Planctomyces sp.]|nr:DNA polymerase III subunit gamma/tau [Planctomyces sp.]